MTGIIAQNVGRTSGLIKAASGGSGGVWTKIKEIIASADSTIDFVDGTDDVVLDSTYPIYVFKFINIHPSDNGAHFSLIASTDSGSSFGLTKTTTFFNAQHNESDIVTSLGYAGGKDLAQSTGRLYMNYETGNENDECISGTFTLYNPSSTTFVKHFIGTSNTYYHGDYSINAYIGGYFNTTSAINGIRFDFDNGTIDAGKIKLYGIGDS